MAKAREELPAESGLYERDYALWIEEQVHLLRTGAFGALDLENLIDEVEGLSRSDRHALENNLVVVLKHLLKHRFQRSKRSKSWLSSIREHRRRIAVSLRTSPSLRRFVSDVYEEAYEAGRLQALDETGLSPKTIPETAPFTLEQALDPDFLPE